jgi:hypothetical protein
MKCFACLFTPAKSTPLRYWLTSDHVLRQHIVVSSCVLYAHAYEPAEQAAVRDMSD